MFRGNFERNHFFMEPEGEYRWRFSREIEDRKKTLKHIWIDSVVSPRCEYDIGFGLKCIFGIKSGRILTRGGV